MSQSLPLFLVRTQYCTVSNAKFSKKCTVDHAELFYVWTSVWHQVISSSVSDSDVDGFTFEIGGRNKTSRQLATVEPGKAFVVKDDIEYAALNAIPLWMFGFLYSIPIRQIRYRSLFFSISINEKSENL